MTKVQVIQGDITKHESDAIVNAAKTSLLGGGGIDGVIHNAAGPHLLKACKLLGGAATGEAKITGAFNIQSANYIIHAVGPIYKKYSPEEAAKLLASCYTNSLDLAKNLLSITFPAISTGIYGYPIQEATKVAVEAIENWLALNPETSLQEVNLIAYSDNDYEVLKSFVK